MSTRRKYNERPDSDREMQPKHCGAHNELLAIAWLIKHGCDVFRNVSAHGLVDIVAMKDGELLLFDVKATKGAGLSTEQLALGVMVLWVLPDGTCGVDVTPSERNRFASRMAYERFQQLRAETMTGMH